MQIRAVSLCVEVVGTSSAHFFSLSPCSFGGSSFTLTGVLGGEARTYTPERPTLVNLYTKTTPAGSLFIFS